MNLSFATILGKITFIFRDSKVIGQSDIIVNVAKNLETLMTVLCSQWQSELMELVHITRLWVSAVSCCLSFLPWRRGSGVVCSVGLRSGDWLGLWKIFNFIVFKKSWGVFAACLRSLSALHLHPHCETSSYQFTHPLWAESNLTTIISYVVHGSTLVTTLTSMHIGVCACVCVYMQVDVQKTWLCLIISSDE